MSDVLVEIKENDIITGKGRVIDINKETFELTILLENKEIIKKPMEECTIRFD